MFLLQAILIWKTFFFEVRRSSVSYEKTKNLKNVFTRLFFVTSNRCKFQKKKDKGSLLILNVQNIVFNVVKICVFEIFLNVLNRAYHVSNSSSNRSSILCPIFTGIFLPLSLYLGGITCLVHC